MKLRVAAQTSAATVLEPSCRLIPTALAQTPADPHKVATTLHLLAAIVRSSLTTTLAAVAATLAAAAATAEAPTMGPTGGPVAGRSQRSRLREQPRLWSLTGRLRRPPED
jgi:hypothetical protein